MRVERARSLAANAEQARAVARATRPLAISEAQRGQVRNGFAADPKTATATVSRLSKHRYITRTHLFVYETPPLSHSIEDSPLSHLIVLIKGFRVTSAQTKSYRNETYGTLVGTCGQKILGTERFFQDVVGARDRALVFMPHPIVSAEMGPHLVSDSIFEFSGCWRKNSSEAWKGNGGRERGRDGG